MGRCWCRLEFLDTAGVQLPGQAGPARALQDATHVGRVEGTSGQHGPLRGWVGSQTGRSSWGSGSAPAPSQVARKLSRSPWPQQRWEAPPTPARGLEETKAVGTYLG